MKPEYKLVAKAKYVELTAQLADTLWREVYARRFSKKQLDAILQQQQSAEAIEEQIDQACNYFIVFLAGKPVGYYAWQMQGGLLFLAHLYLKPEVRGRGIGRDILQSFERLARADGKTAVAARVGQKQLEAQGFFKGGGYRPLRPVQTTLAPGIVWDEFWMEKRL